MTTRKHEQSRRNFLSSNIIGITSVGLSGMAANLVAAQPEQKPAPPAGGNMIQRKLGKTGLALPIVSIGAMNSDSAGLYKRAYEVGIRLFDTAAAYLGGRSEEVVGSVIKELGVRDKVCVATKVHPDFKSGDPAIIKQEFKRIFEGCLKRLQMDHVDILYLHGGSTAEEVNNPAVQEVFTELKKQGKIHFAGISTHAGQAVVLNEMARSGFWDVALVSFNLTMAQDQTLTAALKAAAGKGIGIVGMKSLGGGRRGPGVAPEVPEFNRTAMLKWVLNHQEVATIVPGMTAFDHLDLDWSVASNLSYTTEEQKFLAEKNIQAKLEFCQQCQECIPTCPHGADIPTLMRTHMYAAQYANFSHARMTLDEIPARFGLSACGSCPDCTAHCSNSVNIAGRIRELKSIYTA
jgi:uncharacterized protein